MFYPSSKWVTLEHRKDPHLRLWSADFNSTMTREVGRTIRTKEHLIRRCTSVPRRGACAPPLCLLWSTVSHEDGQEKCFWSECGWDFSTGLLILGRSAEKCNLLKTFLESSRGISPFFFFFGLFAFSRAAPVAHGGSQARGRIEAVAAGLCQSHSNTGSEPRLQPTPQLMAMLNPYPTEQGQGSNPQLHGS